MTRTLEKMILSRKTVIIPMTYWEKVTPIMTPIPATESPNGPNSGDNSFDFSKDGFQDNEN